MRHAEKPKIFLFTNLEKGSTNSKQTSAHECCSSAMFTVNVKLTSGRHVTVPGCALETTQEIINKIRAKEHLATANDNLYCFVRIPLCNRTLKADPQSSVLPPFS